MTTTSSLRNPKFSISAVSLESPQQQLSQTAFLDRKETGFLHFVKYHGLGNDFILVNYIKLSSYANKFPIRSLSCS